MGTRASGDGRRVRALMGRFDTNCESDYGFFGPNHGWVSKGRSHRKVGIGNSWLRDQD